MDETGDLKKGLATVGCSARTPAPLAGVPLSVAALSYDNQLNLGVQSDPDALPDVDSFAGLRRSLEELAAATPPLPAR